MFPCILHTVAVLMCAFGWMMCCGFQCFMQTTKERNVRKQLDSICNLCIELCTLIDRYAALPESVGPEEVSLLVHDFQRLYRLLLQILSIKKSGSVSASPSHLAQLLLRLDYNGWFSQQMESVVVGRGGISSEGGPATATRR